MPRLRILADDLTGALDCAAAFGAGITVHLARPPSQDDAPVSIVATATRDIAPADLPTQLEACVPWLARADIAFKKVDSLLRGNTFAELDHIARAGRFAGLAMTPAFPAQGRITVGGRQVVTREGRPPEAVDAAPIPQALGARGWTVFTDAALPDPGAGQLVAWVPDLNDDEGLARVAQVAWARAGAQWLWAGSAGLAHGLSRLIVPVGPSGPGDTGAGAVARSGSGSTEHQAAGRSPGLPPPRVMLVSASHHPVTRGQWHALRQSRHGPDCCDGTDPRNLQEQGTGYPRLLDLSPLERLSAQAAAALLAAQAAAVAMHAPRPDVLVLVGGDTLLALCRALGVEALISLTPMDRSGWGCARMVGGRWHGVVCHTRSGAFGPQAELIEVLDRMAAA